MSTEPLRLRERIHEELEAPVEDAERLLSELTSADSETKLSILISGWGRALAAALEELAVAIDELRGTSELPTPEPAPVEPAQQSKSEERSERSDRAEAADLGEAQLIDE